LNDITILRWAHQYENNPHSIKPAALRHWERPPGSTAEDMRRLRDGGFVELSSQSGNRAWYKLTKTGSDLIWSQNMEREMTKIPATSVLDAMSLIVGFDDVKERMAWVIENKEKVHFLMIGPPACAKSLFLEAVRSAVPQATIVFGSQTSASGLSDALFDNQPEFLLADELDKMRWDAYSIMLALLERGEILVTKSQKTRGIQLNTTVFAACNKSDKMPPELLSRFVQLHFPHYSREEFIDVCCGYLSRSEDCLRELAALIGRLVYDYDLGDVRTARKVYRLLKAPTEEEVHSAINFLRKYAVNGESHPKRQNINIPRLPGV